MNTAPLGRHYEVNGRRLLLDRQGTGTPSVVFLPGAGLVGLDFWNLQQRVARRTTSVVYDRGGTGWSEAGEWPRTATAVADELAELLDVAAVPGPYVLVGHSLGGAYARRFAQRHGARVAGLVLVETLHEDWDDVMPEPLRLAGQPPAEESMPEFSAELVERFRGIFTASYADWPQRLRNILVERRLDPALLLRGLQENRTGASIVEELRTGGPVPDVPVVVLTALGTDPGQALFLSEEELAAMNEAKLKLYAGVAAAHGGEHRVLDTGGHSSVHTDRPDDVAGAIDAVLDQLQV